MKFSASVEYIDRDWCNVWTLCVRGTLIIGLCCWLHVCLSCAHNSMMCYAGWPSWYQHNFFESALCHTRINRLDIFFTNQVTQNNPLVLPLKVWNGLTLLSGVTFSMHKNTSIAHLLNISIVAKHFTMCYILCNFNFSQPRNKISCLRTGYP